MKLLTCPSGSPSGAWGAGEPLWRRAPKRDAEGHAYTDFLMFAPGLNKLGLVEIERRLSLVAEVLNRFGDRVVFAEANLKLNTLWVSMLPQPGLMSLIVAALRERVPEFKLVGQDPRAYPTG
jgi:hypothetical protein